MPEHDLEKATRRDARRLAAAERDRPTLLAQTAYLGTLAILFILPVVAGAYVGQWLDSLFSGYSVRWTVSLIVLGVAAGGVNVYLFIRERM